MNTVKIQNVRFIRKDSKGQTINLVILDLANGKPSIVRPAKAFVQDLENSFIVSGINNINDPRFMTAMRDLRGATATGEISHHKAGDKWTIEKDHPALNDSTHKLFGKVQVGDQQTYEKDGTRVNGFLVYDLPERVLARQANANAIAQVTAQLADAFDTSNIVIDVTPNDNQGADEEFDPIQIPQGAIDDATNGKN